jgi:CheY-like chemotaxis protein
VDAVLSGHAGVALLLDGDKLSSLHFEDDGDALPRSPGEVHLLFAGAQDLEFLENVGMEEVRGHLDLAGTRIDALHLALNLLDPELSHETRRYAAEDLEELLADDRIDRWVESVLFAHPLPRSADPVGALSACTGRTDRARALLERLESLQPVILEVQQAWEAIPARLFATDEDRKHALSVAVKEGLFRDLVARRAAGERVDDFLLKSLMNPALRQIENAPHVLGWWIADFSEPRNAPLPLEREISYVAEGTEEEHGEERSPTRILLVANNVDEADAVALLLLRRGYVVVVAHDSLSAMQCADSMQPDVVVVDIRMPSMDGYQVVNALRRLPEGTRVVALTGYGQKSDRQRLDLAGIDYLIKPIDPEELYRLVSGDKRGLTRTAEEPSSDPTAGSPRPTAGPPRPKPRRR